MLFLGLKFGKNLGFSISEHCEWGTRVNMQRYKCYLENQSCSCFPKLNFKIDLKQVLCIPGQLSTCKPHRFAPPKTLLNSTPTLKYVLCEPADSWKKNKLNKRGIINPSNQTFFYFLMPLGMLLKIETAWIDSFIKQNPC